MSMTKVSGRWWPVASLLAVGVFSFCLSFDQATAGRNDDRAPTTTTTRSDVNIQDFTTKIGSNNENVSKPFPSTFSARKKLEVTSRNIRNLQQKGEAHSMIKVGEINAGDLPILPSVTVNYLDDEPTRMRQRGELVGRWMPLSLRGGVAAGGSCSFNVQCDDCDPCTDDRCSIVSGDPPNSGKCLNTPVINGQVGGCSDGDPCNGIETCQNGTCEAPGSGTAIDDRPYCAIGGGIDPNGICIGGIDDGGECLFVPLPATCVSICAPGNSREGLPCINNLDCSGGECLFSTETLCPNGDKDCPGSVCFLPPETCIDGDCVTAVCDVLAPSVSDEDDFCVLPCTVPVCARRCDATAVNSGDLCSEDDQCPGGTCLADNPCPNGDSDCPGSFCNTADGICKDRDLARKCNGVDTCDVGTGTCSRDGDNPCGPGGRCSEKSCPTGAKKACSSDSDCGNQAQPGDCAIRDNPGCERGRCCSTSDNITYTCTDRRVFACTGLWFAGDQGSTNIQTCEVFKGCPKYASGIAPPGDFTVNIGWVSDSPCTQLFDIGDDYTVSNGSFLAVRELRFVGQVRAGTGSRTSVEFFDAAGNFIEDTVSGGISSFSATFGVQSMLFDPPIIIPPTGFVVIRPATAFSPNGGTAWAATDVEDVGTNDNTMYWRNGASTTAPIQVCVGGGNDGAWCNPVLTGSDCPDGLCTTVPSVLAFELVGDIAIAPFGACCDPGGSGLCDRDLPWTCQAKEFIFNGASTVCALCGADSTSAAGLDCRSCDGAGTVTAGTVCVFNAECGGGTCVPDDSKCKRCNAGVNVFSVCNPGDTDPCPGKSCEDGPLFGQPCTTNADCADGETPHNCITGACLGTCQSIAACDTGACCSLSTGECTEGNPGTCAGDGEFQGFGTDCDPDCCTQPIVAWQGGDSCQDVTPWIIPVPASGEPPIIVTISGNNSAATAEGSGINERCSLGIFDPAENLPDALDLSWWEGFTTDACSFVRIDMCCSDPIHEPQWSFIIQGCPCLPTTIRGSLENPNKPDLAENARGAPFCDNDNLWMQFGPLPAGTYYMPILTNLAGAIGDYQMHFTVEACPAAVCCHLACNMGDNAGLKCSTNDECPGGTCDPVCDLLDVLACQELDGTFLAPPNKLDAVITCSGGICDTGSCCLGPGECIDNLEAGGVIDKEKCDAVFGKYTGGIKCKGGTCANNPDRSCSLGSDCDSGVNCTGSTAELRQPTPCPICELNSQSRCQFDGGGGGDGLLINDAHVGDGGPSSARADDFRALEQGDITQVCTLGAWLDQGPGALPNCENPPNPDFTVRIYNDANGIPGSLVGVSSTTAEGGIEILQTSGAARDFYRYTLTLDNPIGTILVNEIYWIEIQANSDPEVNGGDEACDWFWSGAAVGEGNNYAARFLSGRVDQTPAYNNSSGMVQDFMWCLNLANEPPDAPVRACCTCDLDNPCVQTTLENCQILDGDFIVDQLECELPDNEVFACPTTQVPDNDNCGSAIVVTDGTEPFSNFCAEAFGTVAMDEVSCGGVNPANFKADIWYEYTATCDGEVNVETCDSNFFDTVLAVYSDGTSTCTCPLSAATQVGECSDDDCIWGGGRSSISFTAIQGQCFLIRLGGFDNAQNLGELDISCGFISPAPEKTLPHSNTTGALACGSGPNYGQACMTCTGGNRDGLLCLGSIDCGTGTCDPDTSRCSGSPCGIAAAGTPITLAWPTSRYIGFTANPAWATKEIGIRVTLVDVDGFAACNGQVRWVGPPVSYCEGAGCSVTFQGSALQDTPHWMDWTTVDSVQIFGEELVSGSRYGIQAIDFLSSANLTDENNYSDVMLIDTGKWGDVVIPLSAFNISTQPTVADVLKIVDKWLGALEPVKARTQLQPAQPNPNLSVGIADVLRGVDAWLGSPYPFGTCIGQGPPVKSCSTSAGCDAGVSCNIPTCTP